MGAVPDTLAACLTPPGRGAIATLGVRGPLAWSIIRTLFRATAAPFPELPEAGRFWFGRMGEGKTADEVVLAVRAIEPVPTLDIHSHGGDEVVRWLLEALARCGARICTSEEFEQDGDDALRRLARNLLPHAATVRTAAILLDQVHGALTDAVREVIAMLRTGHGDDARKSLEELLRFAPVGRHLIEPWRVVIAGAPNVGKSSLINALAGFQRAIVAPTPGTTRDVVTTLLAIDGWQVEVADTAGWRTAAEPLEAEGVSRARAAAAAADLCLWLLDASSAPILPAADDIKVHLVVNKIDLPAAWNMQQVPAVLGVSAKTGEGVSELCQHISQALVPYPPPAGGAVPFTKSLAETLERAQVQRNSEAAVEALTRMVTALT
jgi:tRNA modification GTPase